MFQIGQIVICKGNGSKRNESLYRSLKGFKAKVVEVNSFMKGGDSLKVDWYDDINFQRIIHRYHGHDQRYSSTNSGGWEASAFEVYYPDIPDNRFDLIMED